MNLTLIFTNQDGWQAMAYMKNVFNTTAITGAFLNSDDTGLTTNVFTTDPRLFGRLKRPAQRSCENPLVQPVINSSSFCGIAQ